METLPANYSSTDGTKILDFSALDSKIEEILRVLVALIPTGIQRRNP
jgi:hypothetical protein